MIVHVEREGEAVGEEGGGQEVEMGGKVLALVKPRAGDDAAVIVDDLQERGLGIATVEPAVW